MKTPYQILGVPIDSDEAVIRKAYRRLAHRYHPDKCKDPDAAEQFKAIQGAYDLLSDPERREHYDATGKEKVPDIQLVARDLVAQVFRLALIHNIEDPHADLVEVAKGILNMKLDKITKQQAKFKEILKKLKQRQGTITTLDPESINICENVIEMERKHIKQMLVRFPILIETITLAQSLLAGYACEKREPPKA